MAADSRWVVATLEQVGKFWSVALGTVDEWRRQGMPGRSGRYDLSAIAQWFRTYRKGEPGGAESTARSPLAAARLAREIARARREQLELERMQGKLVNVDDASAQRKQLVCWLDDVLQRLGAELHILLADKPRNRTQPVVEDYVYKLRAELVKQAGES